MQNNTINNLFYNKSKFLKKASIACLLTASTLTLHAQEKGEKLEKGIQLKANVLTLPVGLINVAGEFQLNKNWSLQAETFISPWKSFDGKYAQFYLLGTDMRYYFKETFKGWYLGANLSFAKYKLQKWNYWKDTPYQYDENSPVYISSDLYQKGYSLLLGAVGGYQFSIGDRWNMDVFLGVGTVQSRYKGYHKYLGVRYDDPTNTDAWDRSGEFLPYKGGLMITYQIK